MNMTVQTSISAITVFLQGILSFFSPCVLPLIPLYVGYLAGGSGIPDENGKLRYPRGKMMLNTVFFVLGISITFFLLGFGFTKAGEYLNDHSTVFAIVSGLIMIFFGLYQLGIFGHRSGLEKEHRLPLRLDKLAMGPLPAFLLGFTFSFAWTPCVGPTLGSVLLMAGAAASQTVSFLLILLYTAGFIIPFLAVGFFTGTVLNFFREHRNVVRYTVKLSALLLIVMGVLTMGGFINRISSDSSSVSSQEAASSDSHSGSAENTSETAAPAFELTDQYGTVHKLSDYKGKVIFLNLWATWCPPCKAELPDIQALYEKYGSNTGDVIILGLAGPDIGKEGNVSDITAFLSNNGYSFPVLMDNGGTTVKSLGLHAYPSTYVIDANGNIAASHVGKMSSDTMENLIKQASSSASTE